MNIDEVKAAARAWLDSGKWWWEPGMKSLVGVRVIGISDVAGHAAMITARADMLGGSLIGASFYREHGGGGIDPDINDRATALLLWAQSRGEA